MLTEQGGDTLVRVESWRAEPQDPSALRKHVCICRYQRLLIKSYLLMISDK